MTADAPPRFDEWLDFFFGRLERDCDDEWDMDWEFDASPVATVDLLVYTFNNCGRDLAKFTDRQVAVGLKALLFNTLGGYAVRILDDPSVADTQRLQSVRSFEFLYRDCLVLRSPAVLGHLSEHDPSRLAFVTYMLWDEMPIERVLNKSKQLRDALFDTLGRVLRLQNDACIESALHGLGHFTCANAQTTIDDWLSETPQVRPALLEYARAARTGSIL
jgi:hypothetical protein